MKKNKMNVFIVTILSLLFTLFITWKYDKQFIFSEYILNFIFSFIIVECVFLYIWNKLDKFKIKQKKNKLGKEEYITYFLIILIPILIGMLIYYPFFNETDSYTLWEDMKTGYLNNWHPLLYTFIFFGIPSLFSDNIFSITIFQSFFIIGIMMYLCVFLRKNYVSFKQMVILLLTITLNPMFIKFSAYVVKDVPYSYALLLLTLNLISMVKSDGEWLNKTSNKVMFILSALGVLITRHNGIVPFLAVFICSIIFFSKVRRCLLIMLVSILVPFLVITGPIFDKFDIGKPGGRTELIGIPLGNLSYYYLNGYDFNSEEYDLLFYLTEQAGWDYAERNQRNFNYIKYWDTSVFPGFIEKTDERFEDVMSTWYKATIKRPDLFVRSYLNMTSPIWEIKAPFEGLKNVYFQDGTEGIHKTAKSVFDIYHKFLSHTPLRWIFVTFGEALFLILFSLAILLKRNGLNFKKMIPFIPVLINTAMIMLLITGEEYRFVYSQITCFLPLLIYSFSIITIPKFKKNGKNNLRNINTFELLNEKFNKVMEIIKDEFNCMKKLISQKKFFAKHLKVFKKYFLEKTDNTFVQFFRYLFVGGFAALVNISLLFVFTDLFGIYYLFSNVFSFLAGLIVNYSLSKLFVFQNATKINKKKEFLIYTLIGVIGLGIDSLLLSIFTKKLLIYYMMSKIISTGCVFVWNFGARKFLYKIVK